LISTLTRIQRHQLLQGERPIALKISRTSTGYWTKEQLG
jgi:hypothetical protein